MTESDADWMAVVGNLRKARNIWHRLERILGRKGATPRVPGMFFKAVVQAVLLFESYIWVMNPLMRRDLGGGVSNQGIHMDHWKATKLAG